MPNRPRVFRAWQALLFFCCAVATLSCGENPSGDDRLAVIVQVKGLTPEVLSLDVSATLDGKAATNAPMAITDHLDEFVIYLPPTTEGTLVIDVGAVEGQDRCQSLHATVSTPVHPAPPRVIAVTAELETASPVRCPLAVEIVGDGTVQALGGGLSCSGSLCRGAFPTGSTVVLISTGGARSSNLATWTPTCAAPAATCSVPIAGVTSITATFSKLGCSPAKWCGHNVLTSSNLRAVYSRGPSDVWIVGTNAFVSHFDGTAWKPVTVAPNPMYTFYAVAATGPDDVVIGGGLGGTGRGSLFGWNGSSWSSIGNPGAQIRDLTLSSATTGRAVGDAGFIYHRTGGSWSGLDTSMTGTVFWSAWSSGSTDYIVGTGGFTATAPPGSSAVNQLLPSPTTQALQAVWGTSNSDVWAVGVAGVLARYTGGSSFTSVASPTSNELVGIYGGGVNDYWAIGAGATLLRYTGSWTVYGTGGPDNYRAIHGSSPTDIWLVGDKGLVLQYTP
jgi:hypothetical protein